MGNASSVVTVSAPLAVDASATVVRRGANVGVREEETDVNALTNTCDRDSVQLIVSAHSDSIINNFFSLVVFDFHFQFPLPSAFRSFGFWPWSPAIIIRHMGSWCASLSVEDDSL
jgi:hypothetical protein